MIFEQESTTMVINKFQNGIYYSKLDLYLHLTLAYISFQSMFQHDRYSIFDRDINESLLYRIPSDNQLDGMDDNTLYHTFWK
jgi:hypothetical protein